MQIIILESAEIELKNSALFYERQLGGLGKYFLKYIISEIDTLTMNAGIHRKFKGFHRLLTKKFPYAVYYKIYDNTVFIHAVLDCRANPKNSPQ